MSPRHLELVASTGGPITDDSLRQIQRGLVAFLFQGDETVRRYVAETDTVGAQERLGIYGDAYRLRLLEVLTVDFPGVRALVREDEFERLGLDYLYHHPSRHFSLRYFGSAMSRFLAQHEPWREWPWLAEMAAFEWTLSEAFDAANAPVATLDEVAAIPPLAWGEMRLQFHPSLRRLDLRWNVPAVWTARVQEAVPHDLATQETAGAWVVWRRALRNFFRSLPADEAWALDAARRGEPFAELCEGLCDWVSADQAPARAAGLLHSWVVNSLVSTIAWTLPEDRDD
jgi:hypothetical protein